MAFFAISFCASDPSGGVSSFDSVTFGSAGVRTTRLSVMLKRLRRFSTYKDWCRQMVPLSQSLWTAMPRHHSKSEPEPTVNRAHIFFKILFQVLGLL